MSLVTWTFTTDSGTLNFYPTSSEREMPEWRRELRVAVENLVGGGVAEFNTFGYGEYRLQAEVHLIGEADFTVLQEMKGEVGTLVTDVTTFSNVILLSETVRRFTQGAYEGPLEFGRSG